MKIAVFASLLAHAAAFAPANQASKPSITAAPAAIDDMYGAIDYRCKEYKFDPLKLGTTYEPLLPWFRECEIRHGRTAMLAVLGLCVPDIVRVPGEQFSFEAIPRTIDAHDALYTTAEYQLFLFVGIWDLVVTAPACAEMMKGGREPGDYAWTKFAPRDSEKLQRKKESELLNGRLAMLAVGGIATQAVLSGHGFPFV